MRPGVVPIGRPIGGTEVYVLDRWLRPVPPGVVGQIYLGGVQLARGYLGQPGLTADRFIPDPHGAPGGRLYRTGDLGRMSADGVIEFVGRMDSQVKLRGFRIELGDVEAALNLVPGVTGSVVFLDGDRLLGYVAAPNQDTVTSLGLRAALAEKLPTYMIPAVLGVVPAIPLLPTGKADRSQLPPLRAAPHDDAECEPAPPATEAERQLAQIWAAVLDCDTPPVNVSFFVAGGDSLKSIELVIRAREHGLGLTVEDVFAHPTIRELGAVAQPVAEADDREEEPFALVAEESRQALAEDVEDAYPLSALLGGLVFESLSNPDYRLYITSLRIDGRFDEAALRDAVGVVTRRHPFLRSSVSLTGASEPLQLVHATVGDPVRVIDLQDLDTTEQQAQLESWLDRERHTRFNWSEPPLLRVSVHLLKPTGFQLTLAEPFLDGWSVTLTLTQLLEAYEDLLDGSQPDQEVRPSRYGAFLRAERAALDSDETRQFWAARLHAAQTAGSRLPRLAGGEALPSGYVRLEVDVPLATSDRLRGLARQLAVPLKSVLLAVHVQVLASLSGRAEVLTGLMANARPEARAGTQSVGLFLNVTPLLVRIQGSWRDLVRAVHTAEAETLPHRAYPFTAMLRDAAVTHPIDAVFNFTHFYPYQRVGRRGHIRIQGARATDQTLFPLTVQFRQDPMDSRLGLSLEFSAPGFSAAQRQGIAERYRQTLDQMSRGPDASCAVDQPPEPAEPDPDWSPASLHELFAIQARKDPDAIALHGPEPDQIWSYGRLSAAAAELRARLTTCGVRGGTPVGVCLPRSPELIATVLAVLMAGAGYVPLDPALPPARITELIDAARCAVVVVADSTRPRVHARTPLVDTASLPTRAQFSARNLRVAAEPSAPAYVMFTSGSTGPPKPVVVPHRAVVNRLRWGWETAPFRPSEVCCLKTPIGFVDSIAEMFSGLLHGVPTVIVPDSVQDPARLVQLLSRSGVSRITLVPSLLAEVLRLTVDLNATLPRLRHWTLSGEPLPDDLAAELMRRVPGARVWNLYGSTEVAADALAYQVQGDEGSPVIPLGRPITGVRAYVLDELGNFAPPGTAGEMVIGGRAVGTGYAGNPRLTAERFMPDPAGPAGARLYRTGDLVRCDPDGVFHYLGRGDRQIKVRGVRLEPVEIEMALRAHPTVAEAVVVQRGDSGRQPRLTGYVELVRPASAGDRPEAEVSSMLRTWLRERLSAAAVPEVFVLMTTWPRTPSGKIDHQVLPAPPVWGTATPRPHEPPETLAERELATLWRDRLGIERIDRYDDFFAMGGHSLHAILLAARVEERLGVPFSVSDLFEHPTLEAQAELVEKLVLADADARPTTVSKEES